MPVPDLPFLHQQESQTVQRGWATIVIPISILSITMFVTYLFQRSRAAVTIHNETLKLTDDVSI